MVQRTCLLFALVACSDPSPPDDVIDPPHCGDHVIQADQGEQCDDGNAVSGDGCSSTCQLEGEAPFIHAVWHLKTIDGNEASCPSGDDLAIVIATPLDQSQTPIMDTFPCSDGADDTEVLPQGMYRVKVEIDDHGAPFATSLGQDVALDLGAIDVEADIFVDAGYFAAQWQLLTLPGQPTTCADAGVREVDLVANGGSGDQTFPFPCDAPGGIAGPLLAGPGYMVRLDAVSGMKVMGASPIMTKGIIGRNQVTDLGTVPITLGP
jgi:cysteine-rich repeat protein